MKKYEDLILSIVRYAYSQQMMQISEKIIEKYADDFNACYDSSSDEIEITNRDTFDRIAKESVSFMRSEIQSAELPSPRVMLKVLMQWIFEEQVLPEVERVVV